MPAPDTLFLTFNDLDNRWKVTTGHNGICYGDGETQEEAIASARVVTNAPIFSDTEPDLIIDKVEVEQ